MLYKNRGDCSRAIFVIDHCYNGVLKRWPCEALTRLKRLGSCPYKQSAGKFKPRQSTNLGNITFVRCRWQHSITFGCLQFLMLFSMLLFLTITFQHCLRKRRPAFRVEHNFLSSSKLWVEVRRWRRSPESFNSHSLGTERSFCFRATVISLRLQEYANKSIHSLVSFSWKAQSHPHKARGEKRAFVCALILNLALSRRCTVYYHTGKRFDSHSDATKTLSCHPYACRYLTQVSRAK